MANDPASPPPKMPIPPPGMPAMPGLPPPPGGLPGMPSAAATPVAAPSVSEAARPFAIGVPTSSADVTSLGALTGSLLREQQVIATGSVLDLLCLTPDRARALGGIPKGCTSALVGPPGKGKTRTALAALCKVASSGTVAGLASGEALRGPPGSGREDLLSRLVRIGMAATGLDEAALRERVLDKVHAVSCPSHRGLSWDDLVARVRHLVEVLGVRFLVLDALWPLEPTRSSAAEHLGALASYLQQQGVTALCIGTIRDPSVLSAEGLHGADTVFLIEEMGLTSKEMAEQWGGRYRDKIDVIKIVKSATTPIFPHLVRVEMSPTTGALTAHSAQPAEYALLGL